MSPQVLGTTTVVLTGAVLLQCLEVRSQTVSGGAKSRQCGTTALSRQKSALLALETQGDVFGTSLTKPRELAQSLFHRWSAIGRGDKREDPSAR